MGELNEREASTAGVLPSRRAFRCGYDTTADSADAVRLRCWGGTLASRAEPTTGRSPHRHLETESRRDAGVGRSAPDATIARTETYRLTSAHDIELVLSTTAADGAPSTSTVVFSARGGVVRQQGTPAGQMLVETRLGPREWLVTYLANGTQLMTMRKVVSEDGKTMRQTASGLNAAGQPWEGLLVFERQP